MTARPLRYYQRDAVDASETEIAAGRRTVDVLATGLGKTRILTELAWNEVARGGRVLAACHRYELHRQITRQLRLDGSGAVPIGSIAGTTKRFGFPVDVAMTSTLSASRSSILKRLRGGLAPGEQPYSLILYDEFHHGAAKGNVRWLEALGAMGEARDERTKLVGFSATFTRADRRSHGLADVCDTEAIKLGIDWGVSHGEHGEVEPGETGFLVRPYGVCVIADTLRLDEVKDSATTGDYADSALGQMISASAEQIADTVITRDAIDPRQTAIFAPTVQSCRDIAEALNARGFTTEVVTGETPAAVRGDADEGTGIYGALAKGEIRATSGVMVQTEGWDCPPVSRIVMARPTKLPGLYQQIIGRGLRQLDPLKFPGHRPKRDCEVLDVVGAMRGQKLATLSELLPGVVYDDTALDLAPCPDCGGFAAAQLKAGAQGQRCVCNVGERDPDGGRRRIQGPLEFEFVDLLGSDYLWLQTIETQVPILVGPGSPPVRFAAILPNGDGTYRAAHMALRGPVSKAWRAQDATPVIGTRAAGVSVEAARRACEAWCTAYEASSAGASWNRPDAAWRRNARTPSLAQLDKAWSLGVDPTGLNSRDLSDMITLAQVRQRGIR